MKICVLVVASDTLPHYVSLKKIWKTYMQSHANIQTYFITNTGVEQTHIVDDVIHCPGTESFQAMRRKTVDALECIEGKLYDFVFRTNLSSFIILDRLFHFCETIANKPSAVYACIGKFHGNISFPSGCGFLMPQEVVRKIIANKHKFQPNLIDDVAFGQLFSQLQIPLIEANRITLHNADVVKNLAFINQQNLYHYRVGGRCGSPHRAWELEAQHKLLKIYYNI